MGGMNFRVNIKQLELVIEAELPAVHHGAPGKAATDGFCDDKIALINFLFGHANREGQGYRCGRCIAVILNSDDDTIHFDPHFLRGRFDDPQVCLMWDNPVDVFAGQPHLVECGMGGLGQFLDCVAKDFLALHPEMSSGLCRDAAVYVENFAVATV